MKKEIKNQLTKKEKKEKAQKKWIFTIIVMAFIISFVMAFISELTIPNLSLILGIIMTLLFVFLGVLFDIIGVAVTAADEAVFNSMSSKKIKGADVAVIFKKNADKVSNFCCDVIGDVCGIISGAAATTIATLLVTKFGCDILITGLVVTAIISSLTIGGKAIGKTIAINKSGIILYEFAKAVSNFYKVKK